MKNYKSIDEFTYDECFEFLRDNPDSRYISLVQEQFDVVKEKTETLDDETFSNAKEIADYKHYLDFDFPGASYYQKKYVIEAEEELKALLNKAEKQLRKQKRAKRIRIGLFSALAVIALALACWLTYQPATFLNVTPFDGEVPKYGSEIELTYSTDASRVEVETEGCISHFEITDNKNIVATIDRNPEGTRTGQINVIAHSTMLFISIGTIYKTINISQESGLGNNLQVDELRIDAGKYQRVYVDYVRTDGTSWSAKPQEKWIHLEYSDSEPTLKISVEENPDYVRYGYVQVFDNNGHTALIEIKQNGIPNNFVPEYEEAEMEIFACSTTIDINNDSFDKLSVEEDYDWFSATTNGNSITIKCKENYSFPRYGIVLVKCGDAECEIKVKQKGYKECDRCHGSGKVGCDNNGFYWNGAHAILNPLNQPVPCPKCKGSWKIDCHNCDGEGRYIANYGE